MSKKELYVIKIGGNIIDNPKALETFLTDFSQIKQSKILIHGGGKIATQLGEKMGITTQMVDGRRITDAETINLVTMVYGGLINKSIVAKLLQKGSNALGLTGADGATIISEKRPSKPIDFGFVGDIKKVNSAIIKTFLEADLVPIFAPLTADTQGQILNTNADTLANEIAISMNEYFNVNLIYCFEKNGVLADINNDNSVIKELQYAQYQEDKLSDNINKGMIPKLDNAFLAKKKGVSSVIICHAANLPYYGTTKQIGTIIQD